MRFVTKEGGTGRSLWIVLTPLPQCFLKTSTLVAEPSVTKDLQAGAEGQSCHTGVCLQQTQDASRVCSTDVIRIWGYRGQHRGQEQDSG